MHGLSGSLQRMFKICCSAFSVSHHLLRGLCYLFFFSQLPPFILYYIKCFYRPNEPRVHSPGSMNPGLCQHLNGKDKTCHHPRGRDEVCHHLSLYLIYQDLMHSRHERNFCQTLPFVGLPR